MNELALFAGAGGGILGGKLLGWRTICAVELSEGAREKLAARQNDGCLAPFPIWDDVTTFDSREWRGRVDVVSGGFPCTDISVAGNQAGIEGGESKLWGHMARIIGEVLPRFAFVENSPALTYLGGLRVIGDLTELGYDCCWGVMGADAAGAPQLRRRIWIVANANDQRTGRGKPRAGICYKTLSFTHTDRLRELQSQRSIRHERGWSFHSPWVYPSPELLRMDDGIPDRVDRQKCIGMAQVPAVVRLAWETLKP